MASSIRVGLEDLLAADPDASAAIFMVCDQPYVTAEVLAGLVAEHRENGSPVVASAYGGTFGVPALFSRSLFSELILLEGEVGAKNVIKRHVSDAHFLPFQGGEVDLDTLDDFSSLNIRSENARSTISSV